MWRKARSWLEVINAIQPIRSCADPQIKTIAEFFFGEASAHLNRSNVAHDGLYQLGKNLEANDSLASEAIITKALLHRTEEISKKQVSFLIKCINYKLNKLLLI